MAKFDVGQQVDFKRNSLVFTKNTLVVSFDRESNFYIIENSNFGWLPDIIRGKKYNLNLKKKYLFVREEELSKVGSIKDAPKPKPLVAQYTIPTAPKNKPNKKIKSNGKKKRK